MIGIVSTDLGEIRIVVNKGKVLYCNWRDHELTAELQKKLREAFFSYDKNDNKLLKETVRQIEEYLDGKRLGFDLPLNLDGTDFQRKVWKEISRIGYGETISYKELACRCGNPGAYRAVAKACGANPVAIIVPCHRVVASGSHGGYSGGLDKKLRLLNLEKLTSR